MMNVFLFELRYRLRQPSTYVYFGLMFLLAFGFIASDVVQIAGGDGQVKLNAPLTISRVVMLLTAFGTLISSALVGTAVLRDFEMKSHELFFTTRLTKWDYLVGRFLGSFAIALLVFSGILFGLWFGSLMPWQDAAKLAPFRAASYWQPFWLFVVPNLLFLCAVFFVLGALTRNLMAIYTSGIVVLVGYLIAQSLIRGLDNHLLGALLDPFGLTPTSLVTRYWTPAERNTLLLPVSGFLLWNRLLWSAIGIGVFAGGYAAFPVLCPAADPPARSRPGGNAGADPGPHRDHAAAGPPALRRRGARRAVPGHGGVSAPGHGAERGVRADRADGNRQLRHQRTPGRQTVRHADLPCYASHGADHRRLVQPLLSDPADGLCGRTGVEGTDAQVRPDLRLAADADRSDLCQ